MSVADLIEAMTVVRKVLNTGEFRCVSRRDERGFNRLVYVEANAWGAVVDALAEHWGITIEEAR